MVTDDWADVETENEPPTDETLRFIRASIELAAYPYRDEGGRLLYENVRFVPKRFLLRRPGGDGWRWDQGIVTRTLYKLPELLAADRDAWTFVCEGEKDCDAVRTISLTATTPGAPWWWRRGLKKHFLNRRVCLLPDNDPIGRNLAQRVAQDIHAVAATVRIVELPGLPRCGDISDWLESRAGWTRKEQGAALVGMADTAPDWEYEGRDKAADDFWPSLIRDYLAASSGAERAGNINSILCWT